MSLGFFASQQRPSLEVPYALRLNGSLVFDVSHISDSELGSIGLDFGGKAENQQDRQFYAIPNGWQASSKANCLLRLTTETLRQSQPRPGQPCILPEGAILLALGEDDKLALAQFLKFGCSINRSERNPFAIVSIPRSIFGQLIEVPSPPFRPISNSSPQPVAQATCQVDPSGTGRRRGRGSNCLSV